MKPIHAMLALSIIQLAGAPLASAQVSARASLSHIEISLTDLAPDDGIAPSYTYSHFAPDYDQATTRISYGPLGEESSGSMRASGLLPWANHQLDFDSAALPDHQGAHLTGAARRSGTSLETLDLSVSSNAHDTGSDWVESNAFSHVHSMLLSPHTSLRLTFDIDLQSTVDPKEAVLYEGYASSLLTIEFIGSQSNGGFWKFLEFGHVIDGPYTRGSAGPRSATIDFTNASDVVAPTHLRLLLNAYILAPTAAVPEPSRYAMLAAGLGLIGVLHRRRARQRARGGKPICSVLLLRPQA